MRQGSKVADLSRQFSQAGLTCQGSTGYEGSSQSPKVSNLSRQASASPETQVPGTTAVPVPESPAPAISAAFARASVLAEAPASSIQGQQTSPQAPPALSVALPDVADTATRVEEADSGLHPLGTLPGATSPRILNADEPLTELGPAPESVATPAADAKSPRIPVLQPIEAAGPASPPDEPQHQSLQATEAAEPSTAPAEPQPQLQHTVMALPLPEANLRTRPISARTAPRTSGDGAAAPPSPVSASSEPIQSTLSAVKQDYVQMIAEQEEKRQEYAAGLAGLGDDSGSYAGYASLLQRERPNTQTPQPVFIPAVPAVPRGPSRKGNNALFQMLAVGQTGNSPRVPPLPDDSSLLALLW